MEQDHYYVVTPGIEEAWRDQPESWTFESQPWGKDVIVHNAVSMPRYQLDLRAFEMPVADLNAVEAEVNEDGDAAQRDAAEYVRACAACVCGVRVHAACSFVCMPRARACACMRVEDLLGNRTHLCLHHSQTSLGGRQKGRQG